MTDNRRHGTTLIASPLCALAIGTIFPPFHWDNPTSFKHSAEKPLVTPQSKVPARPTTCPL